MFKNTAGQEWVVFAFTDVNGTNPGEPVVADQANITANVRIDGGAANAVDDVNPTVLEDGYYTFGITAAESNGDSIVITPVSSTANVNVIGVPGALYTIAAVAGRVDASVGAMAANVLTAAAINAAAITAAKFAANAITSTVLASNSIGNVQVADNFISANKVQVNTLTAAKFATDAFTAAKFAADAIDKIRDGLLPTQNAAFNNLEFLFVSSTDHATPVTGAGTMAVTRSIDGGAFGAGTGTGPAEVGNGIYQYDASAADMNGGIITFRFTAVTGTPAAPDDRFVTLVTGGGV